MIKETLVREKTTNIPEKTIEDGKNIDIPTFIEEIKEIHRKLEKTRAVLHLAGDIKVGNTPHEVVAETRMYKLLHYRPLFSRTAKTPLLIVYALMNKSYIFDLQPDKSWIRNLLAQGFDVYLIDWKAPTNVDKFVSFDDYVNWYIDDCIEFVRRKNHVDKVTLHGYCLGSPMSVMYTALHQEKIRNLVAIAPIIDAEKDTTVLSNLSRHFDANKMFDSIGNLPYEHLYASFSILKPFKQGVNKYFNLVENIDNENFVHNFLRIEKWIYDTPPIAGEAFRQWVKDIYQKNLFARNKMIIGDNRINLLNIKIPLLNVVAEADHLVSPECSVPLNNLVS